MNDDFREKVVLVKNDNIMCMLTLKLDAEKEGVVRRLVVKH